MLAYFSMNIFTHNGYSDPVALLTAGREKYPDMDKYLMRLRRLYHLTPWFNTLFGLAVMIEPTDRSIGDTDRGPSANAFFSGALLGLHVLQECVPDRVKDSIPKVKIAMPLSERADDDQLHADHERAESVIAHGEQGAAAVPELTELVESWAEDVTPDITRQPYVRRGFGFVMYIAVEANRITDLAAMEAEVYSAPDWNWDAGLQELL